MNEGTAVMGAAPLLWFLLVLALIPAVLWLMRRSALGQSAVGGPLRRVASLTLGQGQRIEVVELGGGDHKQGLVLGVTAHSVNLLKALDAQELEQLESTGVSRPGALQSLQRFQRGIFSFALLGALIAMTLPSSAWAQAGGNATLPLLIGQGPGGSSYSVPIQTLLFFTALSFLPAVLLMMTGFTRIVIVLSLMRQALGTQAAPPNQVVIGLALFLTYFVMAPTIDKVYDQAWQPYAANQIGFDEAARRADGPLRDFMLKQTRQGDVELFSRMAGLPKEGQAATLPLKVLIPAFVTSELKSAFQIGFMIFVPFLIIDMVVASVLMSLGMMMLSPVLVALPFKLMLFVLADGWNLLLGSLAASFVQ